MDERTKPLCACQDAVQSKDAENLCATPFAEQVYKSELIMDIERTSIP
jgi:hypothetical protein